jgi:CelD/BcsL family acetyltransferase involved in cellulose biosynthesis
MFESRIAADHLTVTTIEGFAPEIDVLAAHNLSGHGFLRAAWYGAGAQNPGRTLLIRRGHADDGAVLAAIPTVSFGPAIGRARKVPGSYWPLRGALIAPDCSVFELAHGLDHAAARGLGPVWRVGPARKDDPTIVILIEAARLAGWTVLSRPAGTSWVIDLDQAQRDGFPRASVAKRLRAGQRKLDEIGTLVWHHVRGADWNDKTLEAMGAIEAQSWIARTTDGTGAKFMAPRQRDLWRDVLSDPVLAENLTATILMLDDRPVTFSFDLDDGPVRYGIASSYVEDLKRCNIGKMANCRSVEDAIINGQKVVDLGVGDTGYKAELGAVAGYDMADLLFVRSRAAALVLSRAWGSEVPGPSLIDNVPRGLVYD